jgi:transcriptional regulator with XRE-family HTH domain
MLEGFGERIRQARKKKGYTQSELAEIVGISTSSVGQFEVGKNKPTLENLVKISYACNISIEWLVTGHNSKLLNEKTEKVFVNENQRSEFEKLMEENEQLRQQVRALTRAINLMPENLGKDEVIELLAEAFTPAPMTQQLEPAA